MHRLFNIQQLPFEYWWHYILGGYDWFSEQGWIILFHSQIPYWSFWNTIISLQYQISFTCIYLRSWLEKGFGKLLIRWGGITNVCLCLCVCEDGGEVIPSTTSTKDLNSIHFHKLDNHSSLNPPPRQQSYSPYIDINTCTIHITTSIYACIHTHTYVCPSIRNLVRQFLPNSVLVEEGVGLQAAEEEVVAHPPSFQQGVGGR